MPFGAVSKAWLQEVHPILALKIQQLEQMLNAEGIDISVVQGLRSWAQQNVLYAQGRTMPGEIVTNVEGGYSWHNFGMAVDCAVDDPSQPGAPIDWDATHPAWKRMEQVGESLGLVSGSEWRTFPDNPHFQLTGRFGVNPDDEVRQLMTDGGMQAVWDEAGITS